MMKIHFPYFGGNGFYCKDNGLTTDNFILYNRLAIALKNSKKRRESMIRFEHVSKCYGNSTVLDDVSFEIKTGEFAVLIGPSGC